MFVIYRYPNNGLILCLPSFCQKVKGLMACDQAASVSGTPGTIVVTKNGPQEIVPDALPHEQVEQIIKKHLES